MNINLNKDKSIGKVLFVVEGGKTEPYLLHRIFCSIMDYQLETVLRDKRYKKYNSKNNPFSQIFVVNAKESNIKYIDRDSDFLNKLFAELIENYDFDVDNAAIYYIFDRDAESNTNPGFIRNLLSVLTDSRDNTFIRQGLLLLNYPSVEAFVLSNFENGSFHHSFVSGRNLKQYLHRQGINQAHITENTLKHATRELMDAIMEADARPLNIDSFGKQNIRLFEYEEQQYLREGIYKALSLLCISLMDLGIIEIVEE